MNLPHLVACANPNCNQYQKRYRQFHTYCQECGQRCRAIRSCCSEERLEDTGFCIECSAKKMLQWAELPI